MKKTKRPPKVKPPTLFPKPDDLETQQLSIRFPKSVVRRVEALAKKFNYKRAELIVELVKLQLEEQEKGET